MGFQGQLPKRYRGSFALFSARLPRKLRLGVYHHPPSKWTYGCRSRTPKRSISGREVHLGGVTQGPTRPPQPGTPYDPPRKITVKNELSGASGTHIFFFSKNLPILPPQKFAFFGASFSSRSGRLWWPDPKGPFRGGAHLEGGYGNCIQPCQPIPGHTGHSQPYWATCSHTWQHLASHSHTWPCPAIPSFT